MGEMDKIKKAFELFKEISKKFELYLVEVSLRSYPEINEIRELSSNVPIYFSLVEETTIDGQNKIFKAIIFTEEIILGYLNKKTPIIKLPKYRTVLITLPAWVYLSEQFLSEYTYRRGKLGAGEREKFIEYANVAKIPNDDRGRFINLIMRLLSPYNTNTILESLSRIEESVVIRIPDDIKEYFEKKFK